MLFAVYVIKINMPNRIQCNTKQVILVAQVYGDCCLYTTEQVSQSADGACGHYSVYHWGNHTEHD